MKSDKSPVFIGWDARCVQEIFAFAGGQNRIASAALKNNGRIHAAFCKSHKFLTKNCKKGLDFSGQDEYNTLSTQENRVLNTLPGAHEAPAGSNVVLKFYFL